MVAGLAEHDVVAAWSEFIIAHSLVVAGLAEHDVVAALSARFTVAEMTAALAYLQQQGLVNVSGVKRPLMLSRLFVEHMEVSNAVFSTGVLHTNVVTALLGDKQPQNVGPQCTVLTTLVRA